MKADRKISLFDPNQIALQGNGPGRREGGGPSRLHTGLLGLNRRTWDRAVRTEHATIAGSWL